MTHVSAYQRLADRFKRAATISECGSMLEWDAAAVMPPGGGLVRGDQLAELAVLRHQCLVAPQVEADLAIAETSDPWEAANLSLMRHAHTRAKALPSDLIMARAKAASDCEKVWRLARRKADFPMVRPSLSHVLDLTREVAAALSEALGLSPYDALMDGYQRGVGADDVVPIFAEYQTFLSKTLPVVEERQAQGAPIRTPVGPFPVQEQQALCRDLVQRVGLSVDHSRLDESAHPFSSGTPSDVRITTRYVEDDASPAILAALHETGHALYERNLPSAYSRQPVGAAAGMAVHESQSLIVEMQAVRSQAFLGWLSGQLHKTFGAAATTYDPGNLRRLWHRVKRSTIRVDADELTYPAHVILRFRLEQALIADELDVVDLPEAWNTNLQALLGISAPDHAQGCLQDIHWFDGAFGYFPSYTLGAMTAAQMMQTAREQIPDLDLAFAQGDLSPLLSWLHVHVHSLGSQFSFQEIVELATGRKLDPLAFQAHLTRRYVDSDP